MLVSPDIIYEWLFPVSSNWLFLPDSEWLISPGSNTGTKLKPRADIRAFINAEISLVKGNYYVIMFHVKHENVIQDFQG